ncbi:MAG: DUF4215 domain-containing protein [Myxococcales bacterium]|nr:DUF4215 domain-containing protein [Myxococcales bacterium]MCB9531889.1 DUF4215 domain-containing protein [Myxococcales bacterium]MCB9533993.1 DUF4215 domain-containing protein [Myxococcales bacterium]
MTRARAQASAVVAGILAVGALAGCGGGDPASDAGDVGADGAIDTTGDGTDTADLDTTADGADADGADDTDADVEPADGSGGDVSDDADAEPPRCGDGAVDEGEECDDGNTDETDGCLSTCERGGADPCAPCETDEDCAAPWMACVELPDGAACLADCDSTSRCADLDGYSCGAVGDVAGLCVPPGGVCGECGNGSLADFEECDDGNRVGGDGCDASCLIEPYCGDGVVDPGESCDDGNTRSGDGCDADCGPEACGDGVVQAGLGEQCDDGNTVANDGCGPTCRDERCGDGVLQTGEACDDGNVGNEDGCSTSCAVERCGDGVLQRALGEACDDGGTTAGDGCDAGCHEEFCGDGIVQAALDEECDDGGEVDGDGCDASCHVEPRCGDGTVDAGEECDDGGEVDGDGCSALCVAEFCGDGVVQAGLDEECDDGNRDDDDGCDDACQVERCGDGTVQASRGEQCDDGNVGNEDGCSDVCALEFCGDGVLQPGLLEECDDANGDDEDGCDGACVIEACGDGVLQLGLGEICDDGDALDGGACNGDCTEPLTGNCGYIRDLGYATGTLAAGTTVGAADAQTSTCGGDGSGDVAYLWHAPHTGTWAFDTAGSEFDTVLTLRDPAGDVCDGAELDCDDDGLAPASRAETGLSIGDAVLIVVDGSAAEGVFALSATAPPVPASEVLPSPDGDDPRQSLFGTAYWNEGDYIEFEWTTSYATLSHVDIHLSLDLNALSCDTQDMDVIINGVTVGQMVIAPTLMEQDFAFDFDPVAGPVYTVRYETSRTVGDPCGSARMAPTGSTIEVRP